MTGPARARPDLPGQLAAITGARGAWLTGAVGGLRRLSFVAGAFLVGSLAAGVADAFSDIDLIVVVDDTTPAAVFADPVAGLGLGGRLLYVRPKPRNSPAGGAYRAVCLDLGGLPLLTDLYLWPAATGAVPAGAQVLLERTLLARSDLAFMALLEHHRTTDTTGADPAAAETTLMLIQLAAKYHARADTSRLAAIADQLGLPPDADALLLRQTLHQRGTAAIEPELQDAVAAVGELLTLADEHRQTLADDRAGGEAG